MKTTIQIRPASFELIAQEFEGTVEEAVSAYKELKSAWENKGEGLDSKTWNKALDHMLFESAFECNPDTIWNMSERQSLMINELKKAYKRHKAKNGLKEDNE